MVSYTCITRFYDIPTSACSIYLMLIFKYFQTERGCAYFTRKIFEYLGIKFTSGFFFLGIKSQKFKELYVYIGIDMVYE